MTRRTLVAFLVTVLCVGTGALSASSSPGGGPTGVRTTGPDLNGGRPLPLDLDDRRARAADARASAAHLGDTKHWLGFDEVAGRLYLKRYKLRGEGDHVEVWVARDQDAVSERLGFPFGDCRNDKRVTVTDKQIRYLIREFDGNIFPKESAAFSRPPARNGTDAVLPALVNLPRNYYVGRGKRLVVLVDNVRDENFFDPDNSRSTSYIAGFFSSQFNELLDRNVVTIDGFDWRHRLGPSPPNQPAPGDLCDSKPARPYLYESVLAHEYQHLLEYYRDSAETTWVNEGLSDWAQTVTGYVDARVPITNVDFDAHVQSFLGWMGVQTTANPNPVPAGPESSLTWWLDQGDDEILSDYGATYTFALYLADHYGTSFLKKLHRHPGVGLGGVQSVLDDLAPGTTAGMVISRWAVAVALDAVLDEGATLVGGSAPELSSASLNASINWDSPDAYSTAGAPPNGSDYVRLRDGAGAYLDAASINKIEFDGDETLTPAPVEWIVDEDPPGRPDDDALYSGSGDDLDRAIVREVAVPPSNATLTLETSYDIDEGFDGAFVQVSTDGGATYTSLSNEHTTNGFAPGGSAGRFAPGLTGASPGWIQMSFDLSAYAGRDVLLAFRYVADGQVTRPGWWIDNIAIAGQTISRGDDLEGWSTPSELRPEPVFGFAVHLIAYDDARSSAWVHRLSLDQEFDGALAGNELRAALGDSAQTVAAIVTYDEPTEDVDQYARYTLTVDGIEQPGG